MSWVSEFLHPGRAYERAQQTADKYYAEGKQYLDEPYQQLIHPEQLQKQWIDSYQVSPYAKQTAELARNEGLDALSGQGLLGSSTGTSTLQAGTSQIMMADRQKYLDDLMRKYELATGVGGQLAQGAWNHGQNSAQMTYGRNSAGGSMLSGLAGIAGAILGGPIGGAAASWLTKPGAAPGSSGGGWSATGGR